MQHIETTSTQFFLGRDEKFQDHNDCMKTKKSILTTHQKEEPFDQINLIVRPQDTLMSSSFFDTLAKITKSKVCINNDGIPLINETAYFYSSDFYESTHRQYFIGSFSDDFYKVYNVKLPSHSIEKLLKSYSQSFRRNVKKSLKENLPIEWADGNRIPSFLRKNLYNIHLESTRRMNIFSLPRQLFYSLFDIEGINIKVLLIKDDQER